jgi:hypothetical protein
MRYRLLALGHQAAVVRPVVAVRDRTFRWPAAPGGHVDRVSDSSARMSFAIERKWPQPADRVGNRRHLDPQFGVTGISW